jgi:hypothetical protein
MAGLFADPICKFDIALAVNASDKGRLNDAAVTAAKGALKDFSPSEWEIVAGSSDL